MKEIEKVGFNTIDNILIYLNIVLGIILLLYPVSYYLEVGDSTLLIIGLALSPANILVALISKYRFELIERYPYIINLPALTLILYEGNFTPRERGLYINKMFSVILRFMILMGIYSFGIEYFVIQDLVFNIPINEAYFLIYAFVTPLVFVLGIFIMYARIYRELKMRI